MKTSDRLRYELLAALATGGLLSFACGGKTGDDLATGGTSGSGSSGGTTTGGAGGSGGIATGGSGGIATGGSGGIATGGVGGIGGGISVGGSGGVGGDNPIILGTPDCSWNCGAGWITCWKGGTVPTYGETPPDEYCPQGNNIDQSAYSPCGQEFYGIWYSGPVPVDGMPGYCCYDSGSMCPGGRPFRVDGELRVAKVLSAEGWSTCGESEREVLLDEPTRNALARAWLADAQLEHASVAAFARLTLQLMALGAPAELVQESQLASLDEIEHAKLCFGLASRYADGPFGPGELRLDGALNDLSLEGLLTTTIEEGCIGETVAAMVAGEQASVAEDARAKSALEQIARDETRHSALAWRIVRWVLEREPSLKNVAGAAFERCLTQTTFVSAGDARIDHAAYRAHGRLSREEQLRAREEAIRHVIRPCLARLFSEAPAHGGLAYA